MVALVVASSCARAVPAVSTDGDSGREMERGGVSAASESRVLAAAAGPHVLRDEITAIELTPPAGASLVQSLTEVRGRRLQLVLRDLAAEQPPGVLFQLYLGLAPGEEPTSDDPRHLGSLGFYGVETGGAVGRVVRYDLGRSLEAILDSARHGRPLVLTIRAASPPAAPARIGRVELVAAPS